VLGDPVGGDVGLVDGNAVGFVVGLVVGNAVGIVVVGNPDGARVGMEVDGDVVGVKIRSHWKSRDHRSAVCCIVFVPDPSSESRDSAIDTTVKSCIPAVPLKS